MCAVWIPKYSLNNCNVTHAFVFRAGRGNESVLNFVIRNFGIYVFVLVTTFNIVIIA